jgi:RNA polymerase sigma-70 factor (ECF subfamily)
MQPSPDEQDIVAKAQAGDEEAVSFLYEAHVEPIFDYISYRVESNAVAEDLTSEVFLHMVRGLGSYKYQGAPFRAWLYRIAANLVTDYYRQRQKHATLPLLEDYESSETDPFDHAAQEDENSRLRLALQALPEDYQDLLILRFAEDLPHTEIAKIMNKSAVALRAMQYRALKALAEQLERAGKRRSHPRGTSDD